LRHQLTFEVHIYDLIAFIKKEWSHKSTGYQKVRHRLEARALLVHEVHHSLVAYQDPLSPSVS